MWQETVSFAEIITRIEAVENYLASLGLSVVDGAINVSYKVTT